MSFLAKGQPPKSPSAFGALAWRSTYTPAPATALGAPPQPAARRSSTGCTSHQPHLQSVACAFLSRARAMRALPSQWARGTPSSAGPQTLIQANFGISSPLLPSYHSITSTPHLFPTRQSVKPSPSRCRYVQSRLNPRILHLLAVPSISSPLRPAREGCACGAMEGGAMGRHERCIIFGGPEALEEQDR